MAVLPEIVECPRLVLRVWHVDDVPAIRDAVLASLEHLRPWMPWAALEPVADSDRREWLRAAVDDWRSGGDGTYGVFLDGVVVGGCGLHRRGRSDTLDIGYWIHVDHVRQGYAAELTAGLTTAAFGVPGIERVAIHHDRANVASRGVPERLGFTCDGESPYEATAPGRVGIDVAWSVTAAHWRSLRSDSC